MNNLILIAGFVLCFTCVEVTCVNGFLVLNLFADEQERIVFPLKKPIQNPNIEDPGFFVISYSIYQHLLQTHKLKKVENFVKTMWKSTHRGYYVMTYNVISFEEANKHCQEAVSKFLDHRDREIPIEFFGDLAGKFTYAHGLPYHQDGHSTAGKEFKKIIEESI